MALDRSYVLMDADDEPIDGERHDDADSALDARARLMATHEDGDAVTVERVDAELPDPETTEAEPITVDDADVFDAIPEGNPFRTVIEDLRESGVGWATIHDAMEAAYDPVEQACYDESFVDIPEYEIQAVVSDADATSGERYKTFTHAEPTESEAVAWVESRPDVIRVEHTDRVGEVTVG